MSILIPSWRPSLRNVKYQEKPEDIPQAVYQEAVCAKQFYNEKWEFWVWQVAEEHNVPMSEAEDACIRGLKKAILQINHVYGDKIARWYEDFLDMGDIFNKVNHPIYINKLGE